MLKKLTILYLLLASYSALGQGTVLTGSIKDAKGGIMPGVTITVKDSSRGMISDVNGNFTINVNPNETLIFSFIGYVTQEIPVDSRTSIDVVMKQDVTQLQELVVTSLDLEKEKKALGYSVTEVKGEEMIEAREVNFANALSGKIAGVNISKNSTGVGGSTRVIIRGNSNITGNNQPLYVVDGIPMNNQNLENAGIWGGSDLGDGISNINPDDIESMTVLKGNAAAALYGSRAQNGVVLITTKKGVARKGLGIEFNSNYVAEQAIDLTDFQAEYGHGTRGAKPTSTAEAKQFGLSSWGAKLDGSNVTQFDGESRSYSSQADRMDFYRTGQTFTNTLSLMGGNESSTFRGSISNLDSEGIVPNSSMNRKTFTVRGVTQLGKKITVDTKANYIHENVKNRTRLSDTSGNPNATIYYLPPSISHTAAKASYVDDNGNEIILGDNIYIQNPYWSVNRFSNEDTKKRLIGTFSMRYDILDWMYLKLRAGIDQYSLRATSLEPYGTAYKPRGGMQEKQWNVSEVNYDFLLGFNKNINEDIGISGIIGGNQMRQVNEQITIGGNDFNIPNLNTVSNLANSSSSYNYIEERINSLYGSLEASYKNYLFLSFTGRTDWFSTLPVDANSYFYPSISLSAVFSDMFDLGSWLDFGKFRASYGDVGGDTDPYQLSLTYGITGQGHQGQALGQITSSDIPNANLAPSSTSEIEFGLELAFLDNKVSLDLAWYQKKTIGNIIPVSISSTSGYGNAILASGKMNNSGIEILLNATPISKNDFEWQTSFNFASNNNEVIETAKDSQGEPLAIRLPNGESRTRNTYIEARVGQPYAAIVGYRQKKLNGKNVFDDSGLPVRNNELEVLGSGVPDFTGGWNNTLRYKNISFSFLLDIKMGGSLYSASNAYAYGNGLHKDTLVGRDGQITGDGVKENGEANTVAVDPQDYYARLSTISELFVYDASFIKLRQVMIGYQLPASLMSKLPFSKIRLSLVARNLWLISSSVPNVDPESTYNSTNAQGLEMFGVPQTRTYGFNINVKF